MGTAHSAVAERPARAAERTDHQLVTAVRRGDDRAFELLYTRYQRRIAAYVCGMVKDYGRAEDITQEVFVSALRRMRQTERPIAFKPWIYEIAKNACIDAYRRARRAEEVSYDADDRLSPSDHTRLVATGLEPDAAVDAKQDLDHLCGAFGGLSDSHHEILVLRELEGLSYKDIGERMGMSRPAVESTLFRARKRLGEEYDELASGARCARIQAIIERCETALGVRDQRRLARHLSHCQPCRRLAACAGLDVPVPARRRFARKIAGLLPVPAFLRPRRGGGDEVAGAVGGGGSSWLAHAPAFADAFNSGWSKAVAGIAALTLAGAGVGITTMAGAGKRDERGTGYRVSDERSTADRAPAAPGVESRSTADRTAAQRTRAERRRAESGRRVASRTHAEPKASDRSSATGVSGDGKQPAGAGDGGGGAGAPAASVPVAGAPAVQQPSIQSPTSPNVQETTDTVTDTVDQVTEPVQQVVPEVPSVPETVQTVQETTQPVTEAVDGVTDGLPDVPQP